MKILHHPYTVLLFCVNKNALFCFRKVYVLKLLVKLLNNQRLVVIYFGHTFKILALIYDYIFTF